MSNKKSNADIDFEDMDESQLAQFINETNSKPGDVIDPVPEVGETVQAEVADPAETQIETAEDTPTPVIEKDDDEVDDPYYRGKTKKQMYEIIRQNNAEISRKANKEHEIMKRLEQLEELKTKIAENKTDDEELYYVDDTGSKIPYDKKDIAVIEQLIERKWEYKSKAQQEAEIKTREANIQDNEEAWASLAIFNPALHAEIKEKVLAEIQKDKAKTLDSKGWLKSYVANYNTTKPVTPTTIVDKQKKLKATTVTSGSISKPVIRKSVDQMDADEYETYMASQGVRIPRI